ncbi:unnamed protein product [Candida verbasci]|uniref:Sodium/calcium exchanger membrane region domain-containing protein n=1 Tax=Candida verbasci TaxID=1227364 RepID=A0A9W4XFY8_9ASCO|nr:unnamed protein product [Candida verbasci]
MKISKVLILLSFILGIYANNCTDINLIPNDERCNYIKSNYSCFDIYSKLYYCNINSVLPFSIYLIVQFITLGIISSEYLCPNLYVISKNYLKINDNMTGITLLAFGNSSPDIFSSYESIRQNHLNLAISELVGASLFITTVVIGSIAILKSFHITKNLFFRDMIMYITIIALLIFTILLKQLSWFICLGLIGLYITYVSIVVYSHNLQKRRLVELIRDQRSRSNYLDVGHLVINNEYNDDLMNLPTIDDIDLHDDPDNLKNDVSSFGIKMLLKELQRHSNLGRIQLPEEEIEEESIEIPDAKSQELFYLIFPQFYKFNKLSKWDKCYNIITSPIVTILNLTTPVIDETKLSQVIQDSKSTNSILNYENEKKLLLIQTGLGGLLLLSTFSIFINILITFVLVGLIFTFYPNLNSTQFQSRIKYVTYFQSIMGFLLSIKWIALIANEIVSLLQLISSIFNINDDLLGITIFALGNSIGDFISNVTIAYKFNMPLIAFSACFGGPLMAICSIGASGLLVNLKNNELKVTNTLLISSFGLLTNLTLLMFLIPRNNWSLDRRIGVILIGNYLLICTLCILAEL